MAEHKIMLVVVTPVKTFYEGFVSSVTLPSSDGDIGIMAGHSPLVFSLKPGIANVRIDNNTTHFVVSEGYAEIAPKMALVVCDSAEYAEELDVKRAVESYKEALANIENKNSTNSILSPAGSRTAGYIEDSVNSLARAKARMHYIELFGSEQQKERLESLKKKL